RDDARDLREQRAPKTFAEEIPQRIQFHRHAATGPEQLMTVALSGNDLTFPQLYDVALRCEQVQLTASAIERMNASRAVVDRLGKGVSGVRAAVLETLLKMLNGKVDPVIPSQGSVGGSGDLGPLAHLAQVVDGEGRAAFRGEILLGGEGMKRAGITAVMLE